jgi:hypothetical protein
VVNPADPLVDEGYDVHIFLLFLCGFLIYPGNTPARDNVVGPGPVKHKANGIHAALIAGAKMFRISAILDTVENLGDPGYHYVLYSIM